MVLAALTFSAGNWVWFAGAALGVALVILAWSYRAAPPGATRWACLGLKLLGFAALLFCLLEPFWSGQRVRPGANVFALVADNSQSLQVKGPAENRTRGEVLRSLLSPEPGGWLEALDEHFEVRRYVFEARLQATRDFHELAFDGRASAIGAALRQLAERLQGRPLAGALLFTDGIATDLPNALPDLTGLPPLYPVVAGGESPAKDIAIQQVHLSQTAFEDAPVSVQAEVGATGYAGDAVVGTLLDRSGRQVAEQTLRSRKASDTLAFRFQFRPQDPGVSFYQLRVFPKAELGATGTVAVTQEATVANNGRVVAVDRGRGPYRVLYVAGRPNWEFKFLNRALQGDDQVQLVGLIRVAKREPKFEFRGRPGESSNPLFRGFDHPAGEAAERYDQPVLVRLNTRDELELRSGFPTTPEELYGYHAVIVDDLEAEFFSPDQAALLQRFVAERGGGFLMLGGMESLQEGQYRRTPIGDMLPVYLDRAEETKPPAALRLNLSREGWLQSWARLRDNESDEKARLQNMPPFQVLNRVRDVKPGASVIATAAGDGGREYPALVVQRFGRGRTAAIALGDLWRWGLHDPESHRDLDKAWRQLVRWLVTDVPNRVDLAAEPASGDAQGAVRLQVRVRDAKFQPLDNAAVTLEVQPVMAEGANAGATNSLRLQAEPALNEAGLYEATYVPRTTAGYLATASVTNSAGADAGRAQAGWSTDLAAEEFRSLTPNLGLLQALAQKTGGEIVAANRLDALVRSLPQRQAPVMEGWSFPIWHTPALFAFALACLLAEWGLRRWKGMP